jgi:hypothetical protein
VEPIVEKRGGSIALGAIDLARERGFLDVA